jgi:hypothetical protein
MQIALIEILQNQTIKHHDRELQSCLVPGRVGDERSDAAHDRQTLVPLRGSDENLARILGKSLALIKLDQGPGSILDPEERRLIRDAVSLRQIMGTDNDNDAITPSQALHQIFR